MFAPETESITRLTLADYDAILAAGTEAAQDVNRIELLHQAHLERNLFAWGTLVDDDGRQLVVNLIFMGYARGTAMRIALGLEAAR